MGFVGFGLLLLLQEMKFAAKLLHSLQLGRGGGATTTFAFYNRIKYYGYSIFKPIRQLHASTIICCRWKCML